MNIVFKYLHFFRQLRFKRGDSLDVNKRQRIPKGQLKLDNPEKLETYGTQDEGKTLSFYITNFCIKININ